MKFYLTLMILLAMSVSVIAGGTFTVTEAQYIVVSGNTSDTLGRTMITPDSIRIVVSDSAGTELFDAWFESADAQCVLNGDVITFFDQWEDINGAASTGVFSLMATIASDADNNIDLFSNQNYVVIGVDESVEVTFNEVGDILDTLQNHDDWVAQEGSLFDPTADSVIVDGSALAATGGAITITTLPRLAYFDTLIYQGPRSLGIYIDSAAGNTNTVIGTDGTSKNPVSTIAAAKTLATALGYNRYYFLNASTFNDAANDLASSHQNWEFIGIGNSNALAFGTQRVDESRFENMDLSGTMHASGGDVLYTNCTFGYITANFNGHALNCWLEDTIVVKADQDIDFGRCQSGVGGNRTPTIDLSGGSSVVQLRGYSGGIRIMNGASTDTISIETDGQVIIASNNTSLNITVRGMLTLTDNGTTTNLTKDAVFSRAEADLWVWANVDTANTVDTSLIGEWLASGVGGGSSNWSDAQRDSVLANMEDGAITATKIATNAIGPTEISANAIGESEIAPNAIGASEIAARALTLAKFDTASVAAFYAFGIWLDDAAANTNTTVGVDGTPANPVSTLAAARTLADSMGLQKYYLINNSVLTLDATYEDWKFVGIGEGSLIDFGSQDVDNSHFEHLMISGTQGGTGVVGLHGCYLNTIDSLEAVVTNSSYSDTISLRASTNTVFNQCYSHIAGNASPGLDFNSAGTTINVDVRHYSGGLTLFNGTSDHTISYETDGQLVIDASCTSLNVTARGNMTITNNGTTTSLTDYAVFNVNAVANYTQFTVKGVVEDSSGNTTIIFQTDLAASTNDLYNRQQVEFISGNNTGVVTQIVDYVGATGVIRVSPGLVSGGANTGDSIKITGSLIGLLANTDTVLVNVSGNAAVYTDSVLRAQQTIVAEDTVTTGDTLAVKKDSLIYQGSASGLSAATIWQYEIRDDTTDGAVDDTSAADHLYSASLGGGGGIGDSTIARIDSILISTGDSLGTHVGRAGVSTTTPSLFMQHGGYSGAAGSPNNIKDHIAAISGGSGAFSCSVFAYNSGWIPNGGSPAITSGNVRMISGVNDYTLRIDPNGWAVFSLDGGTWTAYITALRFLQDTIPQTFTFSADYVDTLTMTAFGPGAPSGPNMVNAYINTWDLVGDTVVGAKMEISLGEGFSPPFRDTDSNLVLIPRRMVAYSDTLGLVQKSVWKSSKVTDIRGRNITFNFKITKDNYFSALFQNRTAPDSSQWKIK